MAELPEIIFSEWKHWEKYNKIQGIRQPGVYLIAKMDEVPEGEAEHTEKRIICIGETCGSLYTRLGDFSRAAFKSGKASHSEGQRYRKEIGGKGEDVYIAAMPIMIEKRPLQEAYVRHVERKTLLDYVLMHETFPKLNKK